MTNNDNQKDFRRAVQGAEHHLRAEYAWRVGQAAALTYELNDRFGDGDILTADSLAHAFLLNYYEHNNDGSLEDCVEQFTNFIRDSAYGLFGDYPDTTVQCMLENLETYEDGDHHDYEHDLLPITDHPIFQDEIEIIDDPYDAIYSHMETLHPEELMEKLEHCYDILEKTGRDDIDLETVPDEDSIEILKALSGYPCRPDFDRQVCRHICPELLEENCCTGCKDDCPNRVVIDIKVSPDDGQVRIHGRVRAFSQVFQGRHDRGIPEHAHEQVQHDIVQPELRQEGAGQSQDIIPQQEGGHRLRPIPSGEVHPLLRMH